MSLLLKCAMTILPKTGRYILFLSVFTLISQVTAVTGQNKKGGVTVAYDRLGSSRVAPFTNSNSFPVRVEFSYQGTRAGGSGEASGEDAVFVAGNYFATYGRNGISITSLESPGLCGRTETAATTTVTLPPAVTEAPVAGTPSAKQ